MRRFLALASALSLAACSQACPPPQPVAVKEWSRDEQRRILAEERALPADSILIGVLEDYSRLRREAR